MISPTVRGTIAALLPPRSYQVTLTDGTAVIATALLRTTYQVGASVSVRIVGARTGVIVAALPVRVPGVLR